MGNANRNERFSPPAVGGISLLVAFAVLCLTVFALLSLTTVRADVRLAEASAEAVSSYYAADCLAQETLARLRNGETPEGVEVQDGIASWSNPISESQNLEVQVRLEDWAVLEWKAAASGEWEIDEGLDLWDGEDFDIFGLLEE